MRLIARPVEDTAALAREMARKHDKLDTDAIEFIETILVYKLPKLSREDIRIMLALNDVQLKQTRFYQEIAEEEQRIGWSKGKYEGRLEGKEEGRQEGKLEGECILLMKLLSKRFGRLPDWVAPKLGQADAAQLEARGERLLDAENIEQIFA